jgi:hypothetical protein
MFAPIWFLPGGPVEEHPFERNGEKRFGNFLVSMGPPDGERVIVGAHYDGRGDTPGADDNASAVAVLLELAKHFSSTPVANPFGPGPLIRWKKLTPVCPPFKGSTEHARRLRWEGVPVKLMIALEMLGYFDDRPGRQRYPFPLMKWFYPREGNYLAVVGSFRELPWVYRFDPEIKKGFPVAVLWVSRLPDGFPESSIRITKVFGTKGFPRRDGDRHRVSAQPPLSPIHRYARHSGLHTHGPRHRRPPRRHHVHRRKIKKT